MFKARWRSDRSKIKALFKLRLEVVQVPQPGWESLVVSLVPLEAGRPSVRSDRGVVVNGACVWERAVFETVKFSRDPKNGKIHEKVYRFLVSGNESVKGRVLGEAMFDFADYAESMKPSAAFLQLKGTSNPSAVLHVTVQRMQDDGNWREVESKPINEKKQMQNYRLSNADSAEADISSNGNHKEPDDLSINGQAELRFHSTRTMVTQVESTEGITKSRSFDASATICTENGSQRSTPRDAQARNTMFEKRHHSFLSPLQGTDPLQKTVSDSSDVITGNGDRWGVNTEWSLSSAPDESLDGSINSSEDMAARDRIQESDTMEKLRADVISLGRQVEVSELELQALRKQVVKERRQGEDLSKEVCLLREERDSLKRKCALLAASSYDIGNERVHSSPDREDLKSVLEETRHELSHEKSTSAALNLQLQKMQDSNAELILAVKDLEELLEKKTVEIVCPKCQEGYEMSAKVDISIGLSPYIKLNGALQADVKANEVAGTSSELMEDEELRELVMGKDHSLMAFSMERKIADLNAEIELYKKDRDDVQTQMEQLALDYEILKQEHHDISTKYEQSHLREQLRVQYECSAHVSIINDLEAQVLDLEKELERQEAMFEEDLDSITKAKIEQEKRAILAEEALQRSKLNNVTAAERLQEEFRKISSHMSTTFAANEKLAMKATTETRELHMQKIQLEESLAKVREELTSVKSHFRFQLKELFNQVDIKTREVDELQVKLKDKREDLENLKLNHQATEAALIEEISSHKAVIEKLSSEKYELTKQIDVELKLMGEIENLKKIAEERECLSQDTMKERDALFVQLNSIQDELIKSREEQENLKQSTKEKEKNIKNLKSDLETLGALYNGLSKSFLESQIEKENLKEQVQLLERSRIYLSNEDDINTSICEDGLDMVDPIQSKPTERSCNDPIASTPSVSCQLELEKEVEILTEKNQSMEEELKEMQGRYSELSLKFAEVEGERQQLVMRLRSLKNYMARS